MVLNKVDYNIIPDLNEDIDLNANEYGFWDINFEEGDINNLTGNKSLENGIIITIMTRLGELNNNPTYNNFGCDIHTLIKSNFNELTKFKIEQYITESLSKMRRIKKINEIRVKNTDNYIYKINYSVISIYGEEITGAVEYGY